MVQASLPAYARAMGVQPVDLATVQRAEKRFNRFAAVSAAGLLTLIGSFFAFKLFWEGNRLWHAGSYLVIVSVVHTRFFDVKKNANPISTVIKPHTLDPATRTYERLFNWAWVVGTVLLALSRWFPKV
jgi:hypothetical protein